MSDQANTDTDNRNDDSGESGAARIMRHPMFEERTPEAAVTQTARVLAWLTECELATLERYERLKSVSKSETERHREICKRAVRHCWELGVPPTGLSGSSKHPRLRERLEQLDAA